MGQFGENYILLEDGSGNLLLEQTDVDSFADKLLLEAAESGASLDNTSAQTDTNFRYNVCQRSGFRALPGELVRSGYGELVLPKFSEPRQLQDFVRVKAESLEGSPRNEATDVFITEEVTIEDL